MDEGAIDTPGTYLYRINVRYRSECIRNTGECYGDKVGMERRMEGIGHRTSLTEQACRWGVTTEKEMEENDSNREQKING